MHQMAAISRHRFSMLTTPSSPNITHTCLLHPPSPDVVSFPLNQPIPSNHTKLSLSKFYFLRAIGGGDGNDGVGRTGGGGGGRGDGDGSESEDRSSDGFGFLGLLLSGWRDRVAADPQFPFKVLMEELVGVTACVLGDMASRPNFGLNELDFVFSTLVVGSIMNFTIMYLLAPRASASSSSLPSIFANCPQSHMFEPGGYTLMNRLGTAVFKGVLFAAVGFGAGLVGTAISNGLIKLRKKMDPTFETPNKPPPTLLNAVTWASHMGVSSNLRYQTLNGIEFLLEKGVPPVVFKSSVVVLRCLNNVIGGMSFVILARMTGSQSVAEKGDNLESSNQSTSK
ncbi:protein RETICULATA-RELATED 3, chloroplastic-like isoform X4 [Hibiscus syriacus]|uniref:protein RETICULATA-RELATED 3, chloroplastic-like isoform X4 n=1 Tax=Hibiscus syriacus TaxID=106335 RepID=UPI0019229ACF|nr:protein RETICULATA-RELATED 3, chloroplastic-like isoform X4 [Hibiscus syriacus]